ATALWVAAFGAASEGAYRSSAAGSENYRVESSADIVRVLLDAGADQTLATDDGTTPFMVAAGLGRSTFRPNWTRGNRSRGAEEATRVLLDAGAQINAVNEADFSALHGAAFRGLNEVVEYLVEHGADIDARDGRRFGWRKVRSSRSSFRHSLKRPSCWPSWARISGSACRARCRNAPTVR
ncbi:MAG: ankyrin repeat domain-containing protein, partial [Acidobacteria bacterium]|nr:ankyrin repeat domain-containing protein [Acidobacteriota bacterium]